MRSALSIVCAQAVHRLRIGLASDADLYPLAAAATVTPVYISRTYAPNKPIFVLALMHRFFAHLTAVSARLIHLFHSTNNNHDEINLKKEL